MTSEVDAGSGTGADTGIDNGDGPAPGTHTATVAELTVGFDDFVLGGTIDALRGASVELERAAASGAGVTVLVRVRGSDRETIASAFEADPGVVSHEPLCGSFEEWLFAVEWSETAEAIAERFTGEGSAVLRAVSREDGWFLRMLFADRSVLSRIYDRQRDAGATVNVRRIYTFDGDRGDEWGLTDKQREVLMLAVKRGYYEVPRRINAEDLAAEVGISHQAISERLRRAHRSLAESAIVTDTESALVADWLIESAGDRRF